VQTYPIDAATADLYGRLKGEFYAYFGPKEKTKRRRTTVSQLGISDNDLWIATTALHHDLILVSSDNDFARLRQVRPLKLESW
jgi:tRNA(fMet)-specific endonuclease VapC